jgi:hypothetical protein
MCRLVGVFSAAVLIAVQSQAATPSLITPDITWPAFDNKMKLASEKEYRDGWAYIISGAVGFFGGVAAQTATNDPLEKGVFVLSQSIGLAAIGYGATLWKNGGPDRMIYNTLRDTPGLTVDQRTAVLRSYESHSLANKRREGYIKAITYGLIGALNLYNASQIQDSTVRNGLYFIGGVNLFAAVSYTFN